MDPLTLLALAWLVSDRNKPSAKPSAKPGAKPDAKPGAKPGAKPSAAAPAPAPPSAEQTPIKLVPSGPDSKLIGRANQQRAKDWIPLLVKEGASAPLAEALSRWIGIESSGNPLALSPIGERGLLQSTKTTALKDHLFTPAEWEMLQSPATTREQHAALALKQYRFHVSRARRWVANPPPEGDLDWVFYAKMNHTRPLDLKQGAVHGPAAPMAADLAHRWAADPKALRRVNVASVVRFGRLAT